MKDAYIYTRVSKKDQTLGEGLERQQKRAEEYISTLDGYKLAEKNAYYKDSGKSGYDKTNILKGALGRFLNDCENGIIKEDSLLVIEFIDRLSRLKPKDARALFHKILDYKINVAIARWNTIVYHDSNGDDLAADLMLTVGIQLAYRESLQKSERITATIKSRQDKGREKGGLKRTSVCPSWLYLNKDRTEFLEDEKKVKIVQRIFNMKIYDRLGHRSIAQKLNEEKVKPIGKTKLWGVTAVTNIIKNNAVTGKFQPMSRTIDDTGTRIDTPYGDVIYDYYPRIISDEDYKLANEIVLKTTSVTKETLKGRKAGFKNLFRHLTFCYKSESPMNFKQNRLVASSIHFRPALSVPYPEFEAKMFKFLKGADFLKLASKIDVEERTRQEEELKSLEAQISELEKANENLIDIMQIADDKETKLDLIQRTKTNKSKINEIRDKIKEIDTSVTNAEDLITEIDFTDLYQREKYNALLRKNIKYIKVLERYIFVCLKNNPYEECVFHLDALGWSVFRNTNEEPDVFKYVEQIEDHAKIYMAMAILERQKNENLTWKQTNRILREKGLQEHYHLYAKDLFEEMNAPRKVVLDNDFLNEINPNRNSDKEFELIIDDGFDMENMDADNLLAELHNLNNEEGK